MRGTILGYLVILMILALPVAAETIYSWTDQDGIRRFSNRQPPEGVAEFQAENVAPADTSETRVEKRRASFDHLVNRANAEARGLRQQRNRAEEAKAAEQRRIAAQNRKERVGSQRRQLESEIEAIKQRGLSTTYTRGMQQAQIDKIKQKIKSLDNQSTAKPAQATKRGQSTY